MIRLIRKQFTGEVKRRNKALKNKWVKKIGKDFRTKYIKDPIDKSAYTDIYTNKKKLPKFNDISLEDFNNLTIGRKDHTSFNDSLDLNSKLNYDGTKNTEYIKQHYELLKDKRKYDLKKLARQQKEEENLAKELAKKTKLPNKLIAAGTTGLALAGIGLYKYKKYKDKERLNKK